MGVLGVTWGVLGVNMEVLEDTWGEVGVLGVTWGY